ncbi:rCG48774, isoform CRA_a [Rattus norvegicus]|uniref:RCG48774, isoform CRA_a n=1 Tax=Rattus norvegicus TaxID=10116 RepID=A6IGW2_RAT|nr:rCG48774, isoform CRA_a [Rattus norvegicus]
MHPRTKQHTVRSESRASREPVWSKSEGDRSKAGKPHHHLSRREEDRSLLALGLHVLAHPA